MRTNGWGVWTGGGELLRRERADKYILVPQDEAAFGISGWEETKARVLVWELELRSQTDSKFQPLEIRFLV